jgi:hypothetical protein
MVASFLGRFRELIDIPDSHLALPQMPTVPDLGALMRSRALLR